MIPAASERYSREYEFTALSNAKNFRKAIIHRFQDYLRGRILEIGVGIGQITELLSVIKSIDEIVGIEPDACFYNSFKTRLPTIRLHAGTSLELDKNEAFDGIIMVNVLEHIEDDAAELRRLHKHLKSRKGYLCIFVPARQEIFSRLDSMFGHFRRYHKSELRQKLLESGFQIIQIRYFNLIGYLLWAVNFRFFKQVKFKAGHVSFFDKRIFPLTNWMESAIGAPPIGQSLITIARVV
jgi:SAM-dependent methyltransferase